jgi:hypothetical protein
MGENSFSSRDFLISGKGLLLLEFGRGLFVLCLKLI